jgi:hypothetical protein
MYGKGLHKQRHRLFLAKAKFLLRANKMQLVHSRPPLSEDFLFFISSNAEEVLVAMSSSSPYDIDGAPASVLPFSSPEKLRPRHTCTHPK